MISTEALGKLARQYQIPIFPNVVREYFQHLLLAELYRIAASEKLLFKGGTALRVLYGSPRFSEDLDFSLIGVPANRAKVFVEELFVVALTEVERMGIGVDIGTKSNVTRGGYLGTATFRMAGFNPVEIKINISIRKGGETRGEVDAVAGDFVPTYTIVHLPQFALVNEKVFGALVERKKPRDFYDLYFMLRKGMFLPEQKKRLSRIAGRIIADAKKVDFRGELGIFLPANQQAIIRNFAKVLEAEMSRQI